MSKLREFWITLLDNGFVIDHVVSLCANPYGVHVIEYSAYEKLKEQNAILIEALKFYADGDNYHTEETHDGYLAITIDEADLSKTTRGKLIGIPYESKSGGMRAREALKRAGVEG